MASSSAPTMQTLHETFERTNLAMRDEIARLLETGPREHQLLVDPHAKAPRGLANARDFTAQSTLTPGDLNKQVSGRELERVHLFRPKSGL